MPIDVRDGRQLFLTDEALPLLRQSSIGSGGLVQIIGLFLDALAVQAMALGIGRT